jgi:MFS family permease
MLYFIFYLILAPLILYAVIAGVISGVIGGAWFIQDNMRFLPVVIICILLWATRKKIIKAIDHKPYSKEEVNKLLYREEIKKKPIMVKFGGKEIPLGVIFYGIISTIILVPVLIYLIVFIIPFWITCCILGSMCCRKIATKTPPKGE